MGTRLLILSGYIPAIAVCLVLAACAVVSQDRFGKLPKGDRLGRIQKSYNYRDGKFQNLIPTPKFSTDAGTNIYTAEDMPQIDCRLISHDHWDHLDYPTIMALKSKVKQVICPLGVGAYFEYWGYPKEKIQEGDWHDRITLGKDVFVHVLPARHYSGRLLEENKTLWAGFALETPEHRIFFSGDSGYGPHFSKIGKAFNGFDLVMLDCGQYDPRWAYIHMTPEEALQAGRDLGAKAFIPVHVGRFTIANHSWDDPFKQLAKDRRSYSYQLLTPRIGEPVILDGKSSPKFSCWWETDGKSPETEQSGGTI